MAGIYIHIPFCKQACTYCNFHFATSLRYKGELIHAILKEAQLRKAYLEGKTIDTIYFGGGTPSLLHVDEIKEIVLALKTHYHISSSAEITLEANPDDLSQKYLEQLKNYSPINRLSVGIQSFHDEDLKYMNRSHSSNDSKSCLAMIETIGFDNYNMDLIFGVPTCDDEQWIENLKQTLAFNPTHLSVYALTVEENTPLKKLIDSSKLPAPFDESQINQYLAGQSMLTKNAYQQYEISNYAKAGFVSKHNSNYWKNIEYLGLGPSAHSFNGLSRSWNISNNKKYIDALNSNSLSFIETEKLSLKDRINEYIMTRLRTIWGVDPKELNIDGIDYSKEFIYKTEDFLNRQLMTIKDGKYVLSTNGQLIADQISADLFIL